MVASYALAMGATELSVDVSVKEASAGECSAEPLSPE